MFGRTSRDALAIGHDHLRGAMVFQLEGGAPCCLLGDEIMGEPLFRQAGAPTEIDVHLHGLASADPNDGVEGNVRSPLHHCVVDRSLLFVHTI